MFHSRSTTGQRTGQCLHNPCRLAPEVQGATVGCHRAMTQGQSHPPTHSACTGMMPVPEQCEALTQDSGGHDEAKGQPSPVGRVDVSQDGLHARQHQGEANPLQACKCCGLRGSAAR